MKNLWLWYPAIFFNKKTWIFYNYKAVKSYHIFHFIVTNFKIISLMIFYDILCSFIVAFYKRIKMDFSSNGVKFKNRNRKRLLVDSDSESDSNNDSNYSSLSSESNYVKHKKAAKRMRRYVCDSSTDSDTENDEQSESDCEYDKKTDFPSHSDNSNSNKSLKIEAGKIGDSYN